LYLVSFINSNSCYTDYARTGSRNLDELLRVDDLHPPIASTCDADGSWERVFRASFVRWLQFLENLVGAETRILLSDCHEPLEEHLTGARCIVGFQRTVAFSCGARVSSPAPSLYADPV